jgi:DNA-directed RNA polymerase specialized sigma24 family protein
MTAVFARAVEFTRGRPVLPWFYAIAANETHAIARRSAAARAREAPAADAERVAAPTPDPERSLADAESRAQLYAAIEDLDPLSAAAIRAQLAADTGDGAALVAADDTLSPAALRKRVSRAYARLRIALGGRT